MNNITQNPRQCGRCNSKYQPKSNRQKYCDPCRREINKEQCKLRYQKTYEKKGYNQSHANNNNWQGGVAWYRTIAKEVGKCERCSSTKFLLVHHKDRNRDNNERKNLEVLCKRCHQLEHECWKQLPQYT